MAEDTEKTQLLVSSTGHYSSANGRPNEKTNHSFNNTDSNKYRGVLSFHNIQYNVQVRTGLCKTKEKVILDDISGVFKPGMNAIMGPTGGGKTSLLDILAGRKDRHGITGTVLTNGGLQPDDFRLLSGYVVQDDVVMGTLSVRENLAFSAALRLPTSISEKEKEQRVEDVIQELRNKGVVGVIELGLQECADSKVGNAYIRGISGGERKRTNVGMELIIRPMFLFMDEPTTGLDASTAGAIMALMAQLSRRGHTIIFSIHQPRFAIFRLFDTLHVLSRGQTAYHGPATETIKYLSSLGYESEEHDNFADYLLDVVLANQNSISSCDHSFGESANEDDAERGDYKRTCKKTSLAQHYTRTDYYKDLHSEARNIYEYFQTHESYSNHVEYPTSFFTQLHLLSKRAFLNYARNPKSSYGQIMVICFYAFIVGGLFFQIDDDATSGIQDRVGAFFLLIMLISSMNGGAVDLFMFERVVFIHESMSGFYRVSSYFLSKLLADIVPQTMIPTILFSVITYYMIGFKPDITKFLIYALNLLSLTYAQSAIHIVIGASVQKYSNAELFIAVSLIIQLLFAGFIINIQSLPSFLAWLEYISLGRYGFKVFTINELKDSLNCGFPTQGNDTCYSGNVYLELQGIDYSTWGLWQNFMAMGIIGTGIFIIVYFKLRTLPKIPS